MASQGKPVEDKWVLFSGPHGQTVPAGEYDRVLLVADGAGIAALLPYLKRLIHGYHAGQVSTRNIHLVWQITDIEIGIAAQPFLNEALTEDQLESGRILRISIYVDRDEIPQESFGQRSTVYPGRADLESIVAKELHPDGELQATVPSEATEYRSLGSAHQNQYTTRLGHRSIHRTTLDAEGTAFARMSAISEYSTDEFGIANQTNPPWDDETAPYGPVWEGKEKMRPVSDGRMIILASTLAETRDALRKVARRQLKSNMDLVEVDFQPFKQK
ncbi:hypothetical protein LTR41_004745 [Exophiala xenobiotica]|nr:hypothetical protein LTR41_004745 [Exophiala xenobiotica]